MRCYRKKINEQENQKRVVLILICHKKLFVFLSTANPPLPIHPSCPSIPSSATLMSSQIGGPYLSKFVKIEPSLPPFSQATLKPQGEESKQSFTSSSATSPCMTRATAWLSQHLISVNCGPFVHLFFFSFFKIFILCIYIFVFLWA